jgi:hypothetical protein
MLMLLVENGECVLGLKSPLLDLAGLLILLLSLMRLWL